MLHEAETGEPEYCETGHSDGPPMSVQVLLNCLMEDTIATKGRSRSLVCNVENVDCKV